MGEKMCLYVVRGKKKGKKNEGKTKRINGGDTRKKRKEEKKT